VVLTRGRVKIATLRPGVGEVILAERGPGDLRGELSASDGRPRSADAAALEDALRSAADFERLETRLRSALDDLLVEVTADAAQRDVLLRQRADTLSPGR